MNFGVTRHLSEDGYIEYLFIGIDGWEDYDLVISLLTESLNVTVVSNEELIWFRVASLMFQNVKFQLFFHEDAGNFLRLNKESIEEEHILKALAEQVVEIIREKVRQSHSQETP